VDVKGIDDSDKPGQFDEQMPDELLTVGGCLERGCSDEETAMSSRAASS
jgi:hypothetical protein